MDYVSITVTQKLTQGDIPGNVNNSHSSKAASSYQDTPTSTPTTFSITTGKDMRVGRGLDVERRKVSLAA